MFGSTNEKSQKKLFITYVIMTLILVGVIICFLWEKGVFLPRWITWENREFYMEADSLPVSLKHKTVYITRKGDGEKIWASPKGMKVQDALACDIDRDGREELLLLCWKIGRYGKHKPFWVKQDEHKWSQHIFVYGYDSGNLRPKWASSYIGQDVAGIAVKRGQGAYIHLLLTDPDGNVSSWFWDSWGFTREENT